MILPIPATWIDAAKTLAELGLVFFAAVQIWQVRREGRERQRAAYAALYAEYWRVQAIALDWGAANLVDLAREGRLYPEELEIRDWAAIARVMGEVGSGTAVLGGFAYSLLTQARAAATTLGDGIKRGLTQGAAERVAADCMRRLDGAAEMLEDALRSAPRYLVQSKFSIVDPESEWGKKMQLQLLIQNGQIEMRDEPRLGSVGRVLGAVLARKAQWLYEASGWAYVNPESDRGKKILERMSAPTRERLTRAEPQFGILGRGLAKGLARVARWLSPTAGWIQPPD